MMVADGAIDRLIIEMPPRHGKSQTATIRYPAWYLGENPDKRVVVAAHTASLAQTFSRQVRNEFAMYAPEVWGLAVAEDSKSVERWAIEGHNGGMVAVGVGGALTGHGADLLIIDDPVKNAEEAQSQTIKDAVWDWYRSVARTRLHPGGAIILIMTRWAEDDLAGRLISEADAGGEQWVILSLPAIAEENDMLGRSIGEPLWPERFGLDELLMIKAAVGSYVWNALYQQRPSPIEGGMLKRGWWQFYKELPSKFDEIIQSWDMTFKDSAGTDFVVGQVWGCKEADKYLLDQVRDRMDFPATLTAVKSLTAKWPQATAKLVEDKANGPAVIAMLKQQISGLIPVEPQGSKVARASAVSPQIEAGNVYLPDPSIAPWVHDFIEECAAFPTGAHDDQVDAMSQALMRLGGRREFYFF